jgi:hypothetical protein
MRQKYLGNDHVYVEDDEGDLETQTNLFGPYVVFDNGSILSAEWLYEAESLKEPFEIRDDVDIPVGDYRFNRFNASYVADQSRRIAPSLSGADSWGHAPEPGRLVDTAARPGPGERFYFAMTSRSDEGGDFITTLVLRGVVAFPDAFVRALVQFNDDSQEALANVLRYSYRPAATPSCVQRGTGDLGGGSVPATASSW